MIKCFVITFYYVLLTIMSKKRTTAIILCENFESYMCIKYPVLIFRERNQKDSSYMNIENLKPFD